MKQRVLPILLSLALCLTLLPAAAWAAEGGPGLSEQSTSQTPENPSGADQGTSGDGSAPEAPEAKPEEGQIDPEEPEVGNGSEDPPYEIGTVGELLWFAGLVNGTPDGEAPDTDAYAVLTDDIDLSSVCGEESDSSWAPIGPDFDHAYTGAFDGGGHTIEGLYVSINSEETCAGLFGVVGEGGKVQA